MRALPDEIFHIGQQLVWSVLDATHASLGKWRTRGAGEWSHLKSVFDADGAKRIDLALV